MSATVATIACTLALIQGAHSYNDELKYTQAGQLIHHYLPKHYENCPNCHTECITINSNRNEFFAITEDPWDLYYSYPSRNSDSTITSNTVLPGERTTRFEQTRYNNEQDMQGTVIPAYKKLTIRTYRPTNTVALGSCAAECVLNYNAQTRKGHVDCHDPLVAPKSTAQPNRFTQSINHNATMPVKRFRNSNKIKSWRAKPKF